MPPLPSVLPDDLRAGAFFGAAFFTAFFGAPRAIIETAARESATLESCSGAGVNAAALREKEGRRTNGGLRGQSHDSGDARTWTPRRTERKGAGGHARSPDEGEEEHDKAEHWIGDEISCGRRCAGGAQPIYLFR